MAPVLGYWNIRGYAQPIRLLLSYTGTEFEDKRYNYGPAPEFDRSSWLDEKFTLGLDFPNLPYYIDGDLKISQSLAILRYLGRTHNLVGSPEDATKLDMVEQQILDIRTALVRLCYNPDFDKLKDDFLKTLPAQFKLVSNFLKKNQWFIGEKITYVDFLAYEVLDHHRLLAPDCLDDYQNLKDFMDRFEALPLIQKYMKSEKFLKWPLNGAMAKFGGSSKH